MTSPSVSDRRPLAARYAIAFVAAMSMVLGPLAFAPAQAAGFTISGTVGGEGAGPLEGVQVELQVYNAQDEYFQSADWAATDELGEYHFDEVEGGQSYRVRALSIDSFTRSTSAAFVLTGNKSLSFTLGIGGSLSGSVREAGTNAVIETVDVRAYPIVNGAMVYEDDSAAQVDPETGSFLLQGLEPGNYEVHISDYSGPHVKKVETATVVRNTVTPMGTITLNVGGTFAGTLQDSAGAPVDFASVSALPVVNGEADYSNAYGASIDEVTGAYVIQGLPAGSYKISFTGYNYFDQFYNNKATVESADALTIALGESKPLGTTTLEKTASVTGLIEDASGNPLEDMGVEAFKVTDGVTATESSSFDYTQPDGTYALSPLHAGTYRLQFFDGLHVYADKTGPLVTVAEGDIVVVPATVMVKKPVVKPPVVKPAPKKAASIKVSGKGGKKKATLTITVRASGVTPTGKVTIKLGSKTLKTVTLKRGKATVKLTKQKKGKRAYKVIYAGDRKVRAKTVTTKKIPIK